MSRNLRCEYCIHLALQKKLCVCLSANEDGVLAFEGRLDANLKSSFYCTCLAIQACKPHSPPCVVVDAQVFWNQISHAADQE